MFTIVHSKRLSDFLDALSDERLSRAARAGAAIEVFWQRRGARRSSGADRN